MKHRVLIVGGGFGGIKAALELETSSDIEVTLISDREYFDYHPAAYRVLRSGDVKGIAIPLRTIFEGSTIRIVIDSVENIDPRQKNARGISGTSYEYDSLVLALGSEPAFFGIPGMEHASLPFMNSDDALALRKHIMGLYGNLHDLQEVQRNERARIIVIGGGPTGAEVASECVELTRKCATERGLPRHLSEIILIEGANRVLSLFPESLSARVQKRMQALGIRLALNTLVTKAEKGRIQLKDEMEMSAGTLVWTAGSKAHHLYAKIPGASCDKRGRMIVDPYFRAAGMESVYVIGDAAVTPFSGMAQTAARDGVGVAAVIISSLKNVPLPVPSIQKPAYAVPVGRMWAAIVFGPLHIHGWLGMLLRKAADLRYFLTILSPWQALRTTLGL